MLKWVADKLGAGGARAQINELQAYTEKLRGVNEDEIVRIVAEVNDLRAIFESKGILVSDPVNYIKTKPAILMRMEAFLEDLIKANQTAKAAALMAWLHTLRAGLAIGKKMDADYFRFQCKEMWKELSRGASGGSLAFPNGFDPAQG